MKTGRNQEAVSDTTSYIMQRENPFNREETSLLNIPTGRHLQKLKKVNPGTKISKYNA